ncbi:conserved hypothetical protein [Acinetobacter proteolyticus]|uniref:Uncharacterized protein n=1 Tax=Acinetobacter proteolyticus TaxID=1776741 RepID=A0A653KCM9_9GAMM|nr:hypothetical protein [Acinetobacter proteolyticus]VXA58259.1 conserved hypothetical protein [Acinetobacter proteolyticus]
MREQFERLPEINQTLGGLHPTIIWFGDDNKYHTSFSGFDKAVLRINGAWEIFQRCRSDYKHLLSKYRATKQLQYSTSEHNARLHRTLLFVKDHFWMNDLDKAMPRVYEEITECLDDQRRNVHNTSCTYQFELAFLNLQDTPELRKIYWSVLGQLQFDSSDQVITPELEQCDCCKAGQQ